MDENGVTLGLCVEDSSTGFSGVHIYPVLLLGRKSVAFDDAWSSKHMSISDEDVYQSPTGKVSLK